jgi:hypothetical protein
MTHGRTPSAELPGRDASRACKKKGFDLRKSTKSKDVDLCFAWNERGMNGRGNRHEIYEFRYSRFENRKSWVGERPGRKERRTRKKLRHIFDSRLIYRIDIFSHRLSPGK